LKLTISKILSCLWVQSRYVWRNIKEEMMTNGIPKREFPTPPNRGLPPMAEYNDEVSEAVLKKLAAVSAKHSDDDFDVIEDLVWSCRDVG